MTNPLKVRITRLAGSRIVFIDDESGRPLVEVSNIASTAASHEEAEQILVILQEALAQFKVTP